tara:strand:- start:9248 stop:9415 length:168 start_codon:yes stop_codon:yes gene_type:complete
MKTDIKEIKLQQMALREVMNMYNQMRELHQDALGPHFEETIFNNWFTQQVIKGGK